MQRVAASVLASLLVLSACGRDPATNPPASPAPVESPKPPAEVDMDAAVAELMAKPEQPDTTIELQHILIAFQGAPRMVGVTRSKDEAKALAKKVYAEAIGGGDFDALVKQYTNDSAPGIYPMTKAGRTGMVKAFGDVGFRLKVGEIGVAPWDATASPFGWHIIKRLK
jgi:parvulin-like peptidyl-prolyl isomerase